MTTHSDYQRNPRLMKVEPVVLDGEHVKLVPLSMDHFGQLCEVGCDLGLWQWTSGNFMTPERMHKYIQDALKCQAEGSAIPFATILKSTSKVVGSTRFANIDKANRHVEIGWTWIGQPWQRTFVNKEAKYLMLQHAFETLGCIRVEFKTDVNNQKSRQALAGIGAKEEGIFRNHMIMENGRIRDSVYFSIIDSQWPEVKANLQEKLLRQYVG